MNILPTTIVDANISTTAGISDGKLATLTTAGKVSGSAITSGTIGGNTAFTGSGGIDTTSAVKVGASLIVNGNGASASQIQLGDRSNTKSLAFKAPDSLSANVAWILPATDGSTGQLLKTDGFGNLSWASGAVPSGAAGGDLTGNFPTPSLTNAGVGAGSYAKVTVNAQGRVTAGSTTIGSAEITDASLVNADISSSAALATSKLSGSVMAISNHGLGN